MKKVVCDRCGKEFVGRNPTGFSEYIINKRVYVDLCDVCAKEYTNFIGRLQKDYDERVEEFLNSFTCRNPREGDTFQDYLNEQLKDPEFKKEWEELNNEE